MRTIYKYILDYTPHQTVDLPIGSKILSVQSQNEKICLWAIVNKDEKTEKINIYIVGTGYESGILHTGKFLGTVQLSNGDLVLHVFKD